MSIIKKACFVLNILNLKSLPSYLFFVVASSLSILCSRHMQKLIGSDHTTLKSTTLDMLVDQSLLSCSLPAHILLKMLLHQRFPDYYPHKFLGDLFFASAEKNSALASSYSRFEWRLGPRSRERNSIQRAHIFFEGTRYVLNFPCIFYNKVYKTVGFVFFSENSSYVN